MPFQVADRKFPTLEELMNREGCTREVAEQLMERERSARCFKNNIYQVNVYDLQRKPGDTGLYWLSIKRIDKRHIHDWRDLQRIKNELIGPDHEGFELYPPESRVVDAANQYHLWVFKDPKTTLGVGFNERLVADWDKAKKSGARQRPLPQWMKAGTK